MKFAKTKLIYRSGTERIVKRFAWTPITLEEYSSLDNIIDELTTWLEYAYIVQRYDYVHGWHDVKFATKEEYEAFFKEKVNDIKSALNEIKKASFNE